ncbi:MAG: sterol desaturase family protein [Alphaproteobacteria bacterium]|nr:sterol desaturase family protein [Alphaproteobacteria bacterium]
MNFRELVVAYFTYPAIQVYLLVAVAGAVLAGMLTVNGWHAALAALAVVLLYPLVEYVLHRWVLHNSLLYKLPFTARTWKRIHFDHHQDPYKLDVLFGSLASTLPAILLITAPVGYAIHGWAGAAAAVAAGAVCTAVFEFVHCIQHLNYKPPYEFLRRIKQAHLLHHFHNETANFGITNFFWDRVIGTYYGSAKERERSPTVFNLGYDSAMAERYPWAARMTREPMLERSSYRERQVAEGAVEGGRH